MNAQALYAEVIHFKEKLTKEQFHNYCERIRQANGDRAMAIFNAKSAGWWDQSDADTCAEILKSSNLHLGAAIAQAKFEGWWV